jgi:hypothetical protein
MQHDPSDVTVTPQHKIIVYVIGRVVPSNCSIGLLRAEQTCVELNRLVAYRTGYRRVRKWRHVQRSDPELDGVCITPLQITSNQKQCRKLFTLCETAYDLRDS